MENLYSYADGDTGYPDYSSCPYRNRLTSHERMNMENKFEPGQKLIFENPTYPQYKMSVTFKELRECGMCADVVDTHGREVTVYVRYLRKPLDGE